MAMNSSKNISESLNTTTNKQKIQHRVGEPKASLLFYKANPNKNQTIAISEVNNRYFVFDIHLVWKQSIAILEIKFLYFSIRLFIIISS